MIFAAATRSPIQFGAYLLTECVGQGGMAVVYKATRQGPSGFEKTVVVKAMLPTLTAQKEFVAMFSAEARLMAQLTHPNIVQVHDFGVVDGIPYLAMEYLPGRNLSQLRAAVDASCLRVPLGAALAIVREVCHGLGYAHDFVDSEGRKRQIIHRDVSPSNVMVCRDGSVKLLDFGVAKIVGEFDYDVTQSFKGKYAYMSPEQVNHKPIDRRVDVFAAGVVLHELLTGKRLFAAGTELETLQRVSAAKVVAPSVDNREVPRALDAIVKKALAKDPSERYMSGAQMAEALDSLESMIWPRKRLAAWLNELFARDWTVTCDVCGKSVLAGGECGECGTAAPDGASSPSVVSASPVVNEAQAALAPIFSSVNTERNVVGSQTIESAVPTEAPDEPLPLPPLPLSHSKKSRAQLSVVRTPLPPPLVEPDTAEMQAPTSGEIEMPGVDLFSAPKLFVVPEQKPAGKSSPKRAALSPRMHQASPTPEPPPTLVDRKPATPAPATTPAHKAKTATKPTPKTMPAVHAPVSGIEPTLPAPPSDYLAETEEATALRGKPNAPQPMTPRGFAPPQPTDPHAIFGRNEAPELSPLQPQLDASDAAPIAPVPAWAPLMNPKPAWPSPSPLATSEPFGFPPAVLRAPSPGSFSMSTSELPRVPSRGRFAIATLLVAAAVTAVFAWVLSSQPRSSLETPVVAEAPAAVAPAAPVASAPTPVANVAAVVAPAPAFGTGGNQAKPAPTSVSAVDAATAAALAPTASKPARRHSTAATTTRTHASSPATPDRTVSEGRIVDPFASMK